MPGSEVQVLLEEPISESGGMVYTMGLKPIGESLAGSSPASRTIYATVAQMDRAADFYSVGQRFESVRSHHRKDVKY